MKSFYVVWNQSTGYTKFQHENYWSAVAEAERLAREHKEQSFIVLQAVSISKVKEAITEKFQIDDGIPF